MILNIFPPKGALANFEAYIIDVGEYGEAEITAPFATIINSDGVSTSTYLATYSESTAANLATKVSTIVAYNMPNATIIPNSCFQSATTLKSFYGSQVESIGNNAFDGCTTLSYINFGSNVHYLGNNAFKKCDFITSLSFTNLHFLSGWPYLFNLSHMSKLEDLFISYTSRSKYYSSSYYWSTLNPSSSFLMGMPKLKNLTIFGNSSYDLSPVGFYFPSSTGMNYSLKSLEKIHIGNFERITTYASTYGGYHPIFTLSRSPNLKTILLDNVFSISGCLGTSLSLSIFSAPQLTTLGRDSTITGSYINKYPLFSNCTIESWYAPNLQYIYQSIGLIFSSMSQPYSLFPQLKAIGSLASFTFAENSNIIDVDWAIPEVPSTLFQACSNLANLSLSQCVTVNNSAFRLCSALTSLYLPKCKHINTAAFMDCENINIISFSECETISNLAFYSCSNLTEVNLPKCTWIGDSAFAECRNIANINLPLVSFIGQHNFMHLSFSSINLPNCRDIGAFYNCSSLTYANIPECSNFGYDAFAYCFSLSSIVFNSSAILAFSDSAFYYCTQAFSCFTPDMILNARILGKSIFTSENIRQVFSNISQLSLPNCERLTSIWNLTFTNIETANLPKCETLGASTFDHCTKLSSVSLPVCTVISSRAFQSTALNEILLPACTYLGERVFQSCSNLSMVSLSVCSYLESGVFQDCTNLNVIYLNYSESIVSCYNYYNAFSYMFKGTQITSSTGSIYVPSSLVEAYKNNTNTPWSSYSNIIFPIPE